MNPDFESAVQRDMQYTICNIRVLRSFPAILEIYPHYQLTEDLSSVDRKFPKAQRTIAVRLISLEAEKHR